MTEYIFTLPVSQKSGAMRLSSARDEMQVMQDPRVKEDPTLSRKVLLEMTILDIENEEVDFSMIENLDSKDYQYLCDFYEKINTRTYGD